jgi:hypothetical protein
MRVTVNPALFRALTTFAPGTTGMLLGTSQHGTTKLGHVECQSEFVWYTDLFEQEFKAFAQVGYRGLLRWPVPKCCNARAERGGATPDAVLILLDDVGHVNDTSHSIEYGMTWGCW